MTFTNSQECKNEINTLKEELGQGKKNYDAVKARNSTLSTELKNLRVQLSALVDKGRNDDALISQLLQEKVREIPPGVFTIIITYFLCSS